MSNDWVDSLVTKLTVKNFRIFASIVGLIVFLPLILYFLKFGGTFSNQQAVWGQFGDFFGGTINPLLSFFSLIAIAVTVIFQSRQLQLGKEELATSKAELTSAKVELQATLEALKESAEAHTAMAKIAHVQALFLKEQAKHAEISARLSVLRAALSVLGESIRQTKGEGIILQPNAFEAMVKRHEQISAEVLKLTDQIAKV